MDVVLRHHLRAHLSETTPKINRMLCMGVVLSSAVVLDDDGTRTVPRALLL